MNNNSLITSPAPISGEAGHSGGTMPTLPWRTYSGVKVANRRMSDIFKSIDHPAYKWIADVCCKFADLYEMEQLVEIYQLEDDQKLVYFFRYFKTFFTRHFETNLSGFKPQIRDEMFTAFLNLGLELLLEGAKQTFDLQYRPMTSVLFLNRYSYEVSLQFIRTQLAYERNAHEEEKSQIRTEWYALTSKSQPKDWQKHDLMSLPPHEKMRVLRNALQWCNDVGFLTKDSVVEYDYITFDVLTLKQACSLFIKSPETTVNDILTRINSCAEVAFNNPAPGENSFDQYWHIRRGLELWFLLKHWDKIDHQLESDKAF